MKPIDIIFPIKHATFLEHLELKYALRSIEKHLLGVRNVWIIGERPAWIKDIIHIPCPDDNLYPARNIYTKIKKACQYKELSEDFLFFNDDHFLLQNFVAEHFPFYFRGDLKDIKNRTVYQHTVDNTIRTLEYRGLFTRDFDTHTPILYNKEKFLEIMDMFKWDRPHAYCIKSLYCNVQHIQGEHAEDGTFIYPKGDEQLDHWLTKHKIFSIADTAINRDLLKRFDTLYPNKSKYEL